MTDFEYTIMSPVMADHLNKLVSRIAQISKFCPSVTCHNVFAVFGYLYTGTKLTELPGKGGVSIVLSSVLGASAQLVVVPSVLSESYPTNPERVRGIRESGTRLSAWSMVGAADLGNILIGPNYSQMGSYADPVAYYLPANVAANGSSAYVPVGSALCSKYEGTRLYEQDVLPYIAWHHVDGIEVT